MKSLALIRLLYLVAGLYDGLLGLAFIVAAPQLFAAAHITPPNHYGYVHFAAALLVVFGWMFLDVARRPVENRRLIVYGVLLKISYVTTVGYHWYAGGVPNLWKYFAAVDVLFAVAFIASLVPLEAAALEPKPVVRPAAAVR